MNLKRGTALFLAILMLALPLPAQAAAEDEGGIFDAYESVGDELEIPEKAGEAPVEQDEYGMYQIGTEEALLAFARIVAEGETSASAVLTANLDVTTLEETWTPIGTSGSPYTGTFDGNGYAVNLNASLFGTISGGAAVRDLIVTGVIRVDSVDGGGGVAQQAQGSSVISRCTSYVTIAATVGTAGGLAGSAGGSARIEDCANDGQVNGLSVGGIVGSASGSAVIEGCVNSGPVSGTSTSGVGGIAGVIADTVAVSGCINAGDVSSAAVGVGGIVGQHGGTGTVSACVNRGTVSCGASLNNFPNYANMGVGGVVGYLSAGGTVESCCNAGAVTQTIQSGDTAYAFYTGGVVGNANVFYCTVADCYNTGDISTVVSKGKFVSTSSCAYAGGVVGILHTTAAVSGCFNMGCVTAQSEAGTAAACSIVSSGSGSVSGSYYLEGCAEDANAAARTAEEFRSLAADLGDGYKDGLKHPLLLWQEDDEEEGPWEENPYWEVTVSVSPVSASFSLKDAQGNNIEPQSNPVSGRYVYRLETGRTYYYSASADGYYSVTDLPLEDGTSVSVVLEADKRIPAAEGIIYGTGNRNQPNTITAGGIYQIGTGATGVMTIQTAEAVTLIGAAAALTNLYINCTVENVNLTLWNVSITDNGGGNLLNFRGSDNYLYFRGVNLLEMNGGISGYALIHVPAGTGITLGGMSADDTLYLYKYEMGAGIGGNGTADDGGQTPEYNGRITITQGRFFMKGSKQGALIGAGANASTASGTPGDIIINGGVLNLIAVARGAAIGGAAGSSGASTGTNVYMNGGTLNINVDYSGAAIGGGGYNAGNDQEDGGTLYYSGGSIRTYIDKNAVSAEDLTDSLWAKQGVTQAGVNGNIAITAEITDGTVPLYLCVLDTAQLGAETDRVVVFTDKGLIYDGGLHTYSYVNQDKLKTDADWVDISDTTTNWGLSGDPCLYIYLTGKTHTLTVNGEEYTAEWDGKAFYVHPASAKLLEPPELTGAAKITVNSVILTPPAPSEEEAAAVLEYRMSSDRGSTWSEWQASPVFTGLKANTEYFFQARYRAVNEALYATSLPRNTVMVKTPVDPNAFKCYAEAYGSGVAAAVSGTSLADFVDESGVLTADLVTGGSGITQLTAAISGATLAAMAEEGVYAFALETDLGMLCFDYRAVGAIARGGDAVLTVIKTGGAEYSFRLTVNETAVTQLGGGSVYLELPYSRGDDRLSVMAYDDAGNELKAEYNPRTETVAFTVSRMSIITIKEVRKGDPYASVWDGLSLDVSWFTPGKSAYYIDTPAQLMGLAALVNGIYNDEITTIVGDVSYIVDNVADGSGSGGDNESTDTYHYGSYDFNGATVYLTANLDMGGSGGANYMPIGGQYLMAANDYSTKISSSFCGVFDGDGHTVSDIYCDRYCSGNYGDGSSVGLIGRLGVHDSDPANWRPSGAAVRNVAVDGYFYANRSVGGIVGKIGKTNGGVTIESCANFATVINTDTKGCGGIVGAGWNGGTIRNCYNAGTIQSRYPNPTGGISGSNEVTLENCYNVGSISAGSVSFAMAIGTNNGGAPYSSYVINCWYLEGSASGGGYYSGNTAYNDNALTSDEMKSAKFVMTLGDAFVMDSAGINDGYPVLTWQGQGEAGVIIQSTTTVKNGAAVTTVTEKAVSASVAAALKAEADTLFLVSDTDGVSVDQTVVEIPRISVKEIADASLSLSVETADGSKVTMPPKVSSAVAETAAGTTVELAVTPRSETYARDLLSKAEGAEGAYLTQSATVSIGVSSGGVEIDSFAANFRIEIPVDSQYFQAGKTYDILCLRDGALNRMSGECVLDGGQLYVSFTTSGLGTFTVLRKAPVVYDDVLPDEWYYEAVMYVTNLGLMNGIGDNKFDPNGTMDRAMLVTVLHRLEDTPAVAALNSFSDVPIGTWYTDAVIWANVNGIVKGYGNGSFGPTDSVTREQIATILYRYMQYRGLDVSAGGLVSGFPDGGETSDWACEAMQWAIGAGIIVGNENKALNPGGEATRAEVATMLQRLINLMEQ